jgi:hypothetical protein
MYTITTANKMTKMRRVDTFVRTVQQYDLLIQTYVCKCVYVCVHACMYTHGHTCRNIKYFIQMKPNRHPPHKAA